MRNQEWLVSVGAGRWQLSGISAAQRSGIKVLALDGDTKAPGLLLADHGIVCDIRDTDEVLEVVQQKKLVISGAISFATEAGLRAVGKLRDTLSLPGPGSEVIENLTNKVAQRNAWEKAGIPNPAFWRQISSYSEGYDAIRMYNGEVIVKPIDSAGSRGVTRLATRASREKQEAALQAAFAHSLSHRAIIESILPGNEYTVETFADQKGTHVLAVTVKEKIPGTRGTVANELATPNDSWAQLRPLTTIATRALEALGYTQGPGHVEIMWDKTTTPALVEAAGRGAGFMVFDKLVPLVSGYDVVTASSLQAVGRQTAVVSAQTQKKAIIRFFPSRPGVVRHFSGFTEANSKRGVEAEAFVKVGEKTSSPVSDGDRLGYILSVGKTNEEARQRINRAGALISFEITPEAANKSKDTGRPKPPSKLCSSKSELPIALTFDLDPDYFDPSMGPNYNSQRLSWRGIQYGVPAIADFLSGIKDSYGGRACATWLPRVDNQIENIYGDYGQILDEFDPLLRNLFSSGDEIAWHPHLHKEENGTAQQETNAQRLKQVLVQAQNALSQRNWRPRATRIGGNYGSGPLMQILEDLGIEVDSSAMPGRRRTDNHYLFDWSSTPTQAYCPARSNYRTPGTPSHTLAEIPLTMLDVLADYDERPRKRYFDLSFHSRALKPGLEKLLADAPYIVTDTHPSTILEEVAPSPHGLLSFSLKTFRSNLQTVMENCARLNRPIRFVTLSDHCLRPSKVS